MRLIGCHIENFGKLSDLDIDFNPGTNVINEENGYGKSTLSTFLKVMLYGFDNETKKGELSRERSRYLPWQGGNYGGSVTLQVADKKYLITRMFGKKDSDDFFELRDAETMLVNEDYGKNIGEQIFGIDSESFKRSVMFSQNDCETKSTDGINAKLGNLTESTDDINNFEKVDEGFHKLLNEMSDTRKTGSRHRLKTEIYEMKADLRTRDILEDEYRAKLNMLENEKHRLDELNGNIDDIETRRQKDELNKSYYVVKDQYEKLIKDRYTLENELKASNVSIISLENAFSKGIPNDDKLDEINNSINELTTLRERKKGEEFSYSELSDFNNLSSIFEGKNNPHNELDEALYLLDELEENSRNIVRIEDRISSMGKVEEVKSQSANIAVGIIMAVVGITVAVVGWYVYSNNILSNMMAIAICAVGILILVISVIVTAVKINACKNTKYRYDEYVSYNEELKNIKHERTSLKNRLTGILSDYGITYDKYDTGRRICRMRDDYDYFRKLQQRRSEYDLNGNSIRIVELCDELDRFFMPYTGILSGEDYIAKLYSLKAQIGCYRAYIEKQDKLRMLSARIADMEQAPNFLAVKTAYEPSNEKTDNTSEALLAEMKVNAEKAADNCNSYRNRIEALEEKIDSLNDLEVSLAAKEAELQEMNKRAELLELTRGFLNEAKTSFVKRYSEPITNSFRKYFELLDGNDSANYSFDANTNLNIYSEGKIRKPEAFSRGLRDLAGIAFRLSLTDAMYKNEKPYLIMDDPFVNLDDTRMQGAKKLIDSISEEYQVIYFTCSSSRVPNV
ncbi:MAG: AAA family ATPase [Lachnospiraceae bacterium]|nr:AAA family ATPase [Lachnospiraceae bacterium]